MTGSVPGFDSPAVGFEQPFEMLAACHDRVRRSLVLLQRLMVHVRDHGHDAKSRSAAADVLRYFERAAPLHHEDEERHVFPLLAGACDPGLTATVAALQREHRHLEAQWAGLRVVLTAWSRDDAGGMPDDRLSAQVTEFERLYAAHLCTEEDVVFPAARACIDAAGLAEMSLDMARRRGAAARVR